MTPKIINLINVPLGTKIFATCSDGSSYLIYKKMNGIYANCITENGNMVYVYFKENVRVVDMDGINTYHIPAR